MPSRVIADERRRRAARPTIAMTSRGWSSARGRSLAKARLQRARQPAVVAPQNRSRAGQERVAERRRDDHRHRQRRQQRHDVRERERRQQPAFDASQPEDRQEHQDDDDGREHDRRADLERRVTDDRRRSGRCSSGGLAAFSRSRRTTFSTSMIASSTSAPMAIAMPPSVIVLMVASNARRTSTAAASDSGMAVSVIAAARRFARNSTTIDDHEQPAVAQGVDDVVDRHLDEIGLPEDPAVDRHARRQLLLKRIELLDRVAPVSSTVFAPGCFCTPTMTAGLPLRDPSPRLSAAPSRTSATSRTSTGRSPRSATTRVADLVGRARPADGLQHVLLRALHVDAGRCVLARAAHRVEKLVDRDAVGAQLVGMGDHLELPLGAADRRHLRHARHARAAGGARRYRRRFAARADRRHLTRSRRRGSRP